MSDNRPAVAGRTVGQKAFALLRALAINALLIAVPIGAYYYAVIERQSRARTEQGFNALKQIQNEFDTRLIRLATLIRSPHDERGGNKAAVERYGQLGVSLVEPVPLACGESSAAKPAAADRSVPVLFGFGEKTGQGIVHGIGCASTAERGKHLELPAAQMLDAPSALSRFERVELVDVNGDVLASALPPVESDPARVAHRQVATSVAPTSVRAFLVQAVRDRQQALTGQPATLVDKSGDAAPDMGEPSALSATIAGKRYRIYLLPFVPESELLPWPALLDRKPADTTAEPASQQAIAKLYLVGIQRQSALDDATTALGVDGIWYLIVALLLSLAAWPLLRVLLLSEQESVSPPALAGTAVSLLFVPSLLVIVLLCFGARGQAIQHWNDRAADYADAVAAELSLRVAELLTVIDDLAPEYRQAGQQERFLPAHEVPLWQALRCDGYRLGQAQSQGQSQGSKDGDLPLRCEDSASGDPGTNPNYCHLAPLAGDGRQLRLNARFDSLINVDRDGQLADRPQLTIGGCQPRAPRLDLSSREYVQALSRGLGWPLPKDYPMRAGTATARAGQFIAQRIYSRADGSRTFIVAVPRHDDDGYQGLFGAVASLRSLSAAIRPPNLGFAVIDNLTGTVLFHTDDERSLLENFFSETGDEPKLLAALRAGQPARFDGRYQGIAEHFATRPLADMPWTVVSFYETRAATAPVITAALIAVVELIGFILALVLLVGTGIFLLRVACGLRGRELPPWQWLWPQWRLRGWYPGGAAVLGVLVLVESRLWAEHQDEGMLLLVSLAVIAGAGFAAWLMAPPDRRCGLRLRWLHEPRRRWRSIDTLSEFRVWYLVCGLLGVMAIGTTPAAGLFLNALPRLQEGGLRHALVASGASYERRVVQMVDDLRRLALPSMQARGRYPDAEAMALATAAPGTGLLVSPETAATACDRPDQGQPLAHSVEPAPLLKGIWQAVAPLLPDQRDAALSFEPGRGFQRDTPASPLRYTHRLRFGAPVSFVDRGCVRRPAFGHLLSAGQDSTTLLLGSLLMLIGTGLLSIKLIALVMRRVLGIDVPFTPPPPSLGRDYDALELKVDEVTVHGALWWYLLCDRQGRIPSFAELRDALTALPPWQCVDLGRPGLDWQAARHARPVLLINFSRAVLSPEARKGALSLIESCIGDGAATLVLTAMTPPWGRLCQPDEYPEDGDLPDAEEAMRWRAVQARLAVHHVIDPKPVEGERMAALPADSTLRAELLDERIALAELLGRRLPSFEDALSRTPARDLKDFEDLALHFAAPQLRREWAHCTIAERLALFQMAHGHVPNPLNRRVLDDLLIRRLVVLAPEPRIASSSFRKFVQRAETPERFADWIASSNVGTWSTIRVPFFILLTLLVAWFAYSFGDQFNTLSTLLGALVAVLGSFGKVAGFVRGSGGGDK